MSRMEDSISLLGIIIEIPMNDAAMQVLPSPVIISVPGNDHGTLHGAKIFVANMFLVQI